MMIRIDGKKRKKNARTIFVRSACRLPNDDLQQGTLRNRRKQKQQRNETERKENRHKTHGSQRVVLLTYSHLGFSTLCLYLVFPLRS